VVHRGGVPDGPLLDVPGVHLLVGALVVELLAVDGEGHHPAAHSHPHAHRHVQFASAGHRHLAQVPRCRAVRYGVRSCHRIPRDRERGQRGRAGGNTGAHHAHAAAVDPEGAQLGGALPERDEEVRPVAGREEHLVDVVGPLRPAEVHPEELDLLPIHGEPQETGTARVDHAPAFPLARAPLQHRCDLAVHQQELALAAHHPFLL